MTTPKRRPRRMTGPDSPTGTVETIADDGTRRSLGREAITTGSVEVPLPVYRTNAPTIFAGFQQVWGDGTDEATGTTFEVTSGAGAGSCYGTIRVTLADGTKVYEYFDVRELLTHRVEAIVAERAAPTTDEQG